MLKNLRLFLMGHNEEAGATQLIPVVNTNLLHNALVHVADNPPRTALQIHGDRQEIELLPEALMRLMPSHAVELAAALGAPKEVIATMQTAKVIEGMLMPHAGETGQDEGGVETLTRILEGHKAAIAAKDNQAPEPTRFPLWLYKKVGPSGGIDRQTIDDEGELKDAINAGWCGSEQASHQAAAGDPAAANPAGATSSSAAQAAQTKP
jgi:hypothetical protein